MVVKKGMKLCSVLLIFLMLFTPMVSAQITLEEPFLIEKEVLDYAISNNDFEIVFNEYFLPSLNDNLTGLLLFGAELNVSNGRVEQFYGERHMFGRLESAESIIHYIETGENYISLNVDVVYEEVQRLLFGPWAKEGNTIMEVVRPIRGKTLSLITGKWRKNVSNWAIRIDHYTEYFGNLRRRYLSFDYVEYDKDNYLCRISILR